MRLLEHLPLARALILMGPALLLGACGGGSSGDSGGSPPNGTPASYTIGGAISGLTSSGLVLSDGTDNLAVTSGASSFTFPTALASGSGYTVTVSTEPSGERCTVANAIGTVGSSDITNVAVSCAAASEAFSGVVSTGMPLAYASIEIEDAAGDMVSNTADGSGSFSIQMNGVIPPVVVKATGPQVNAPAALTGDYTGTISGGASGSFSVRMLAQGLSSFCSITVGGATSSCIAAVDASGGFYLNQIQVSSPLSFSGKVSACSSISGTWDDSQGLSGTFSGSANVSCEPAQVSMVSVLKDLDPSGTTVVNVTPLTTAIASELSPDGIAQHLDPTKYASSITANFESAVSALESVITAFLSKIGVSGSPISTPFMANGTGYDQFYDQYFVAQDGNGIFFIGPVATLNRCYLPAQQSASAGCVTYSDPETQISSYPNLCGFEIAAGTPVTCDPTQSVTSAPVAALPPPAANDGIATSAGGKTYGAAPSSPAASISGTWAGSWQWAGLTIYSCPAVDGGPFTMTFDSSAAPPSISATLTANNVQIRSNPSSGCSLLSTDPTDKGSLTGTVSGSSLTFGFVINASVNDLDFVNGSGRLLPGGKVLIGSAPRTTSGTAEFALTRVE